MKINLGCGADIKKGYINVDHTTTEGVDVVHDLEKTPYPFKENTVDEIIAFNILEHIHNFIPVMEELHRICKKNAIIKISVPHYNQHLAYQDPTHVRFFTPETFNYFSTGKNSRKMYGHKTEEAVMNFFSKARFDIIKLELKPGFYGKFVPFKKRLLRPLSYMIGEIVQDIYVELKVVK